MKAPAATTAGRALFGALGVFEVVLGAWAEIWPARFYASFPGGGWHWVRASGAYDEHLLRDFGGLSLALAVVTLAVALRPQVRAAAVAATAWELYSVPHLAYHAGHLDALPAVQDVATICSLALSVVVPVVAAALVWRGGRAAAPPPARPEPARPSGQPAATAGTARP